MLGVSELNKLPVWGDELSTLTNIGAFNPPYSPINVLRSLLHYTPLDMPLFFISSALWAQLVGWSQFALRLLSLFSGLFFIAFVYRFAADCFGKKSGLFATLVLSTNLFMFTYFSEFRTYTFLLLIFMIHTWLYVKIWQSSKLSTSSILLFTLTGTIMHFTHLVSVVMQFGLVVSHFTRQPKNKRWCKVGFALVISNIIFLPYAISILLYVSEKINDPRSASTLELLLGLIDIVSNHQLWVMAPLTISLIYIILRKPSRVTLHLVIVSIVSIFVLLLLNSQFEVIAITRMRYFLPAITLMLILFSVGLTSSPKLRVLRIAVLVIWIFPGLKLAGSHENDAYTKLFLRLREFPPLNNYVYHLRNKLNGDEFVLGFTRHELINEPEHFSSHSFVDYYLGTQLGIDGAFLHSHLKRYRLTEDTRAILAEHPHILLAHDPANVPPNYPRVLSIINDALAPCHTLVDEPTLSIRRYAHPLMDCDHKPAPIDYANGIRLIDRAATYDADKELIQVLTWWHVPDADMLDQYNISLQILDRHWQNRRQNDRHLYELSPWAVRELSTADLPPASYQLALILYHRDSGAKVPGVTESGGESAGIIPILPFTIDS